MSRSAESCRQRIGTVVLVLDLIMICFGFVRTAKAEDTTTPDWAYLGQTPPTMSPEKFAPGLVSTDAWEASGTFSRDGREFFYTWRPTFGGSDNRLMYMRYENGAWTQPVMASFAKQIMEYEPFITTDNQRVYYNSDRPGGEIWYAQRTETGWSEARPAEGPLNDGWAMFVTATNDQTFYFTGEFEGRYGICLTRLVDGEYQPREYLPEAINGIDGASHPFIAPDESYMLFDGQPTGPGVTDLYIACRDEAGQWKPAQKLGPQVNATHTENCPSVSPDGKYFFFYRRGDIWWVDAKLLDAYKAR